MAVHGNKNQSDEERGEENDCENELHDWESDAKWLSKMEAVIGVILLKLFGINIDAKFSKSDWARVLCLTASLCFYFVSSCFCCLFVWLVGCFMLYQFTSVDS